MSLEESDLQELVPQSKESEKMNSAEKKFQKRMAQREEDSREWTESMEKHPRVGLLASPNRLTEGYLLGEDAIDALKDFEQTYHWARKKEALNTEFLKDYTGKEDLTRKQFEELTRLAFSMSFDAIRHTANPTRDEYVILYYAGHGLSRVTNNTKKSSMPILEKVKLDEYFPVAKNYAKHLQDQPVKGGELCLHDVGYCGLYGLIQPWIASVKVESMNNPEEKANKHLIIILDSCNSGMIAQDLEELNEKEGPWNENGCSISIQAACGANELTFGGYFTPCFLTLNEDKDLRNDLEDKWKKMKDAEKEYFRSLPLPSPRVVTTRKDSGQNSPTMEFSFNNDHKLTLFSDPGFFKFCSFSIFERDECEELKKRVLGEETAREFMKNTSNFTIVDYKLKTQKEGLFAGNPLGLFLIADPGGPKFAVCAHVHFAKGDTSRVGRINLVHSLLSPRNALLYYEEDHGDLSKSKVKKGRHKIEYAVVPKVEEPSKADDWEYWEWNKEDPLSSFSFKSLTADQRIILKDEVKEGAKLVKECHGFVERNESGRWNDLTKWNMTSSDLSYSGMFRQKERSQWMEEYQKKYDKN